MNVQQYAHDTAPPVVVVVVCCPISSLNSAVSRRKQRQEDNTRSNKKQRAERTKKERRIIVISVVRRARVRNYSSSIYRELYSNLVCTNEQKSFRIYCCIYAPGQLSIIAALWLCTGTNEIFFTSVMVYILYYYYEYIICSMTVVCAFLCESASASSACRRRGPCYSLYPPSLPPLSFLPLSLCCCLSLRKE